MARLARFAPLLLAMPWLAWAGGAVSDDYKWLAFLVFGGLIAGTLYVTYLAASRIRSAADFYAAGSGMSSLQNGWAIAGDYLSAASFLGVTGLICLWGFDGFIYSVGWLVAYITVLLVIAEPCRNIGKYTLADILAFRNDPRRTRIVGALSTIIISTLYLTAQMVGGGILVKTLVGVDYEVSLIAVGILMLGYVLFGGMVATTWVQIIKAVMLVVTGMVLVILVWLPYGFSLPAFLQAVVDSPSVQARVAQLLGDSVAGWSPEELGTRFLQPGLLYQDPLDQMSLGLALVLGTAGLPHILMRFFTVPTAQDARRSVIWAMVIIGGFYLMTLFIGLGAALEVGPLRLRDIDPGGNMAAPLLAQFLGGGPGSFWGNLMLAFIAAVAFATIVAVVAGLVLAAASAMAHDLYVGVIRGEEASAEEQIKAARIATVVFSAAAIVIGIAAKGQNVAHLVALAFAVAASANFPCVLLTLYWRRCNTAGILAGMVLGSLSAIVLVLVSPNMHYPKSRYLQAQTVINAGPARLAVIEQQLLGARGAGENLEVDRLLRERVMLGREVRKAQAEVERYRLNPTSLVGLEEPWFPLRNPGLISVPLGFLGVVIGSLLYRDRRAESRWNELLVRQHTGIVLGRHAGD